VSHPAIYLKYAVLQRVKL